MRQAGSLNTSPVRCVAPTCDRAHASQETQRRFGDGGELDLNARTSSVSSGVSTPPGLSDAHSRARWRADTDHTSAFSPVDPADHAVLILQSFLEQKAVGKRGLSLGMDEIDFAERLHRYYEEGIPELDKPPVVRGETTVVVLQLEGYLKDPTTVACVYLRLCVFDLTGCGTGSRPAATRTRTARSSAAPA